MINEPKLTVSGYRGIWGESLTPLIVQNYTRAFIKFIQEDVNGNPTILIGRDGRESGPEIKKIIMNEFNKMKVHFIDGDILPTPTVLFAVHKHKYDGAIIITASHNPIEYNGLKFVTNNALFTNEKEVEKIKIKYEEEKLRKQISEEDSGKSFQKKEYFSLTEEHADQIVKHINIAKIKARKFKVAVDMINASACVVDPYLFKKLGIELIPLNNIPNGKFTHRPEPLKENLGDIEKLVKKENCDIGFAHDPDADRLVVIDENGLMVGEEYTLALGTEAILSKNHNNKVVINMSTSQMNKDIALKYNGICIHTKVGEANVVNGIIENNAIMGGEGGGAIIYPVINLARDSFASLAVILELLAERNQTISECIKSLPKYVMLKDKVSVSGSLEEMYSKMKNHFKGVEVNELDGLRLDFSDSSWIHLRPSNTEPIIRLYGEAKTKERINSLFEETKKLIQP
jgi:phosphomannomutase